VIEEFQLLLSRLDGYLRSGWYYIAIEVGLIWLVVYGVFRFLRGTRGARVFKGLLLIVLPASLLVRLLGGGDKLERLNFLYSNFLAFISLTLVIVFQPELRRALVRLGEARLFSATGLRKAKVVEEILASVEYLARNKVGALIAVERTVGLGGIIESGTRLEAEVSRQLLNTIFWPGSALHDLGVVIRGDRVLAAGVQFPLAEGEALPQELGSRHRAALGLSQEVDALVIVVSEETGTISIAERGQLRRGLSPEDLKPILSKGIATATLSTLSDNGNDDSTMNTPARTDA
jgi:diadenylate cyclase